MPDGSRTGAQITRVYSVLTIKAVNDEQRIIEGIATTPSTDRSGDIVEPKGLQFKLPLPFLMQHAAVPEESIGHVIEAKVTPDGIRIRAQVLRDPLLPELDKAWARIKLGLVRGLSIGFNPLEAVPIDAKAPWAGARYTKGELLEISAVVIAANQDASITTIKSLDTLRRAVPGRSTAQPSAKPAGATANPSQSKGNIMQSMQERITALEGDRVSKAARMSELREAVKTAGRGFSAEEQTEFDGLATEIGEIDIDLKLLKVQAYQASTAVPAETKRSAPFGFVRNFKDVDARFKGEEGLKRLMCQLESGLLVKQGMFFKPSEVAERRYGKTNPTLVSIMKANEVAGAGSGSGEALAELVSVDNRYTGDFIDFIYGLTVFDRLPLRPVPANVAIKGLDGAYTGYWVGESKGIPMSQGSASSVSTSPLKVAGLTVLSNELIRDSSPAALDMAGNALREALAQVVDTKFFSTDAASSGVSPAGILNGLAAGASNGGDAQSIITDVKALMANFISNKNASGLVWVMTPTTAVALSLMKNALGQPEYPTITPTGGTFAGFPVETGDNVGSGDVILMKPSEIWKIGDLGVQFSISQEAMIEQSSAPIAETDTPTAATQAFTSMFQEESTAIKVVRPINFGKRRSYAVAYIGDAAYGGEVS